MKLTEFGYRANAAGKHVYSNFKMQNLPNPHLYTHYNDPLDVLGRPGIQNSLILMSEVGILLDQMRMYQIDHQVWVELRQHRKDGNNIIADAQSMSDVAYTFRNLIQFQYDIYAKYKLFGRTFQLVRVHNPKTKEFYGRRYWSHNPKYFKFYDTLYKLEKNVSFYEMGQAKIESPWTQFLENTYGENMFGKVEKS
ncbi:hypothetical protein FE783_36915 [Paenibacillus mesophilus]|uniref:hypothetical protein n=1 Tax=Paenibacillus mesophilus TaxID=2582849 RepID=UPI00110E13A4|nr:hypothetical protein [Paenibacillus mesophilus]TMV42797.1 hypothetical protein FE783_36915 [Paenibacillus mesophilus]